VLVLSSKGWVFALPFGGGWPFRELLNVDGFRGRLSWMMRGPSRRSVVDLVSFFWLFERAMVYLFEGTVNGRGVDSLVEASKAQARAD
jgi:hypothetical protein